jgi:RNA polymerase sigma-70 factor (ECF subfamily)
VFLAAFRGLPDFHGDASVSTWLHRIAVNTALMRVRSLRRSREQLIEQGDVDQARAACGLDQEPLQWCPADPETALARRQTAAFVASSLGRISREHRSVIMLRDFDDLSTAQAAAKLGTSSDALKMRLHRARASLRDVLTSERAYQDAELLPAPSNASTEMVAA